MLPPTKGPRALEERGVGRALFSERTPSSLGKTAPTLLIGHCSWGHYPTSTLSSSEGRDCAMPVGASPLSPQLWV